MLEITVENQPEGRVRVALNGRLDTQTYAQCEERINPLLTAATRVLVFDMAQLDYLSSMGLRVLMKTSKALAAHGGKCLLTRIQPPIRSVIDIANALPAQNIFASVEEADHYLDVIQRRVREQGSSASTLPS
jgi:anti-sigma B factor antagonist